ncbi:MAG: carboxypeptidase-like regulatory domain-containing protein [Candidatus Marinimicrobia bacterium]|nr:carboxypeptidase-like regulatory domain-containing protein [Candidatus Neomarinimicrobiota bacterium]MCF7828431.1 carboxypeptidase-like regulatory domain-containing protein [Candidatus Neomarinimicrobiota bacterium]MCF7880975.1 carboxypeptidase-like regulatory domain-containing protein [Candidatus Neomarinimicrobiota bacterium]
MISGTIHDAATGEPLTFVNVLCLTTGTGTTTNGTGHFTLALPEGRHIILVSHIGYHTVRDTVRISVHPVRWEITLAQRTLEGDTVEVRESALSLNPNQTVLLPRQLEYVPQFMGEADLVRTLQTLPGVTTLNEFQGGLYVRGGVPYQNLILLDGGQLYYITHLYGIYSLFNMDAIKQARLVRGGLPASYGGGTAGMLEVLTKSGNRNRYDGAASLGLVSSKVHIGGPVGTGSWFAAGRRTYIDWIVGSESILPEYYFGDLNARATQHPTPRDYVTATMYFGNDRRREYYSNSSQQRVVEQWGNRMGGVRWRHEYSPHLILNSQLTSSRFYSSIEHISLNEKESEQSALQYTTGNIELQFEGIEEHRFTLGLTLRRYAFRYLAKTDIDTSNWFYDHIAPLAQKPQNESVLLQFSNRSRPFLATAYFEHNWRLFTALDLRYGGRGTYFTPTRSLLIAPRIQLQYQISPTLRLHLAGGRYYQYIHQSQFGWRDNAVPDEMPLLSNFRFFRPLFPEETPLRTTDVTIGLSVQRGNGYAGTINWYYKITENLSYTKEGLSFTGFGLRSRIVDLLRHPFRSFFESGSGLSHGLEVLLRKTQGRLQGWASYTWSRTTHRFPSVNNGTRFPPQYDREHQIGLQGQYVFNPRWRVSWVWLFGTGQPYTSTPNLFWDDVVKNDKRLPPYHRMDIAVTHSWKAFGWEWEFGFGAFNLYNHRNVTGMAIDRHRSESGEIQYVEEPVKASLPLIPNVTIKVKF